MTSTARACFPPTRYSLLAGVFACAMLSACANKPMGATAAAPTADADMAIQSQVGDPRHDMVFLSRAMQSDMLEISASQLALQQASDPQVKQFAQRMVQDHTQNSAELKQLAARKGMASQPGLLPVDTARLQKLQAAQGAAFDRLYVEMVAVQAHAEAVALFDQQVDQGSDMELRSFAAQKLPILQHHLQMGQALRASVQ
jgi:putative membrane protein